MTTNTHQIKITNTGGMVILFRTFEDATKFAAGLAPPVGFVPIRTSALGNTFTVSSFVTDPHSQLEMAIRLYGAYEPERVYQSMSSDFQYQYVGWGISSKYYRKV